MPVDADDPPAETCARSEATAMSASLSSRRRHSSGFPYIILRVRACALDGPPSIR